ncbi:MAG: YbjN domain-containing protein, partial [Alphaproteobacteria bacterium]
MDASYFHPLDLVEEIVAANDWQFERAVADELIADVGGRWANYSLMFGWRDDLRMMQFACACDLRITVERRAALYEMLSLVNDQMPLGHFVVDPDSNLLVFRHASLMRG